jgi:hypothetical protein
MATEKRKGLPWGAIIWAGLGTAMAVRALYRPSRAVVADGYAKACAGRDNGGCRQSMLIESFAGSAPVYSPVCGRVISSGQLKGISLPGHEAHTVIRVAARHDPVILEYAGALQPQVQEGEEIGAGQQIALASELAFGVTEIRSDGQTVSKPAGWRLAACGSVNEHTRRMPRARTGARAAASWSCRRARAYAIWNCRLPAASCCCR